MLSTPCHNSLKKLHEEISNECKNFVIKLRDNETRANISHHEQKGEKELPRI